MVNPNTGAVPDGDAIIVEDMADLEVLKNDVVAVKDVDAFSCDMGRCTDANKGRVGSDLETGRKSNLALDPHDLGIGASNGSNELFGSRYKDCLATFSTGGRANGIVFGISFKSPSSQLEVV